MSQSNNWKNLIDLKNKKDQKAETQKEIFNRFVRSDLKEFLKPLEIIINEANAERKIFSFTNYIDKIDTRAFWDEKFATHTLVIDIACSLTSAKINTKQSRFQMLISPADIPDANLQHYYLSFKTAPAPNYLFSWGFPWGASSDFPWRIKYYVYNLDRIFRGDRGGGNMMGPWQKPQPLEEVSEEMIKQSKLVLLLEPKDFWRNILEHLIKWT